jgi:hypothetical protein
VSRVGLDGNLCWGRAFKGRGPGGWLQRRDKKDDVRVAYVSEREGKVIFVVNI